MQFLISELKSTKLINKLVGFTNLIKIKLTRNLIKLKWDIKIALITDNLRSKIVQ